MHTHTHSHTHTHTHAHTHTHTQVGGIRLEASSRLFGSKKPSAGFVLLVYARDTDGYRFIECKISNITSFTVFRQYLTQAEASDEELRFKD